MNPVMENWTENFLLVSFVMALFGWFIAGAFWRPQLPFLLRLPIAVVGTIIFMVLLGALSALLVSLPVIPTGNLMPALTSEFTSTFSGFVQLGGETSALWIPAVLIRFIFLTVKSLRQARAA